MKYKIMVVEDSVPIREELVNFLTKSGYELSVIADFSNVTEQVKEIQPHLILLDINLPEMNGFDLCTRIRKDSNVPIIFVTSRSTDLDELMSITLGGDDFITKPYNTAILQARITSLLKRAYSYSEDEQLEHRDVKLHMLSSRLEYQSKSIELTRNELKIMHYLLKNKGIIVSRNDLIEFLWDSEVFVDDNTLSVNMTRIRAKLEQLGVEDFIHTKRGQGYII